MFTTQPRRQLLLAATAFFVLRLLLSLLRTGPVIVADEIGYLTNARVIAGGTPGQLQNAPFYRGGYSLLLAPILAVVHDPHTAYRLVLVLNALLAALLVPLLYLFLVRSFGSRPQTALWAAIAAAAYPSTTVLSQVALSENLLFPLCVVWALCWVELLRAGDSRGRVAWAVATGGAAAALYAVHGRTLALVAVTLAGLAVLALRRRVTPAAAIAGGAVALAGLACARAFDHYLVDHNYGGKSPDEVGQRLSSLEDAHGWASLLRNLVGQTWYLTVATLGLLVWAAFGLDRDRLRAAVRRDAGAGAIVLVLLAVSLAGLLVLSALSFPDESRPDMLVYGRYTEILVPPLLAAAVLHAAGRRAVWQPLAWIGLLTVAVVVLRTTIESPGDASRWNVASLPFVTSRLGTVPLVGAAVVASGALVVLTALRRSRPHLVALGLLALFIPTMAYGERTPVLSADHGTYPAGWTSPSSVDTHGQPIAFDVDHRGGLYVDQWFIPKAQFVLFSGRSTAPPSRFVISARDYPAHHPRLQLRTLWVDEPTDHALFEVVGRQGGGS